MIAAEWSDDLSAYKRSFNAVVGVNTNNVWGLHMGGNFAMFGTLGAADAVAPKAGKTANIVVNGAFLNAGTRVILWGEYYE